MYVTEFQKRGLPHVHMLLVLESNDKLRDPKDYDSMVREEIHQLECEPQLNEALVKHMIHRPCGVINRKSPCIKDGRCKKMHPKQFLDETRQGTDSYPEYRKRFDESISLGRDRFINNRWVVPYNSRLLLKYDCHINVEICTSIKDAIPNIIQEELAVDIPNEDIESVAKLNNDQMIAFKTIMNVIVQKHSGVFFVDGPGGTRKTFLYRALIASLRSRGEIILATASSGIAATLLLGDRTAYSRF
ncbi:uncharacterized protein LOC127096163 [Lathyrus oleraceus]|uniref:uncharacterized protein LOC127096163 n=1 Tax=Pisum sativum TaxID=3888 RepID=UPI0021D0E876|nr:uncharacterized protein LOC127096163 [Pisum sativum]